MNPMPLDSKRITILMIGIAIMVIGFFVMTLDKEPFGFGFLGITLGPILVLIGVITPIFALFNFKKK
jgi:fumarate reductase subunit C